MDLVQRLEDPMMFDNVLITHLESKMIEFGKQKAEGGSGIGAGVLDDSSLLMAKDPKQDKERKRILELIREYLQVKIPRQLHELLPNVL